MRMKLGLLQDQAAIERQIEREAASASSKRRAASPSGDVPTVLTEAEAKAQEEAAKKEKKEISEKVKQEEKKKEARRIRPLTEAKAIDSGATFISESFLFLVAAGLIGFETWRSRRKVGKERKADDERMDRFEEELKGTREELGREKEEKMRLVTKVEEMTAQMRVLKVEAEKSRGGSGNGSTGNGAKVETVKEEKPLQKKEDAKDKKSKPAADTKHKPHKPKEKLGTEKSPSEKPPTDTHDAKKQETEKKTTHPSHTGS